MDNDVRELLVCQAISILRSKYCWYISRGDYEKMVELYTPDGGFEYEMDGKRVYHKGTAALRECLAHTTYPGFVFPMIHNEVTFVNGDEAHGVCSMEAKSTSRDMPFFSGYYHDKFRVHAGAWRFSERRFFRYFPVFERSGLDVDGMPETGLSTRHKRLP
jgi:hypothetical protein